MVCNFELCSYKNFVMTWMFWMMLIMILIHVDLRNFPLLFRCPGGLCFIQLQENMSCVRYKVVLQLWLMNIPPFKVHQCKMKPLLLQSVSTIKKQCLLHPHHGMIKFSLKHCKCHKCHLSVSTHVYCKLCLPLLWRKKWHSKWHQTCSHLHKCLSCQQLKPNGFSSNRHFLWLTISNKNRSRLKNQLFLSPHCKVQFNIISNIQNVNHNSSFRCQNHSTVYVRQRNTAPKTWLDFQNVPQDEPDAETAADNNDMDSSSKSIASTSGLKWVHNFLFTFTSHCDTWYWFWRHVILILDGFGYFLIPNRCARHWLVIAIYWLFSITVN